MTALPHKDVTVHFSRGRIPGEDGQPGFEALTVVATWGQSEQIRLSVIDVMLARLHPDPPVFIRDEILFGLDVAIRHKLLPEAVGRSLACLIGSRR